MSEEGAREAACRLFRKAPGWSPWWSRSCCLAPALYEHIGTWRDSRVLKQIGRSIDIGGRTLNIHCTGDGSPTVVFVSGRMGLGYNRTPT